MEDFGELGVFLVYRVYVKVVSFGLLIKKLLYSRNRRRVLIMTMRLFHRAGHSYRNV